MALVHQNGRPYYYRNKRVDGKVVREYIASGHSAELAADQDARQREQRLARREAEGNRRRAYDLARVQLLDLAAQVETLTRAMLIDAGYHQRNRGPWRRRMK